MRVVLIRWVCFLAPFLLFPAFCSAQDSTFQSKHAMILFPYPMYTEKWRSSIGITIITTPEDITEEQRIRLPAGDFQVLRKITPTLLAKGQLIFQFLQNQTSLGLQYLQPLSGRFFLSAGSDMAYWFGVLKINGFNSKAEGWMNDLHFSAGFKARNTLLLTLRFGISYNLYYRAVNGHETFSSAVNFYNGEHFTLALEQPFIKNKHLVLAFSTNNQYFIWQTWSLFYKTDRKIFYPQVSIGLIL